MLRDLTIHTPLLNEKVSAKTLHDKRELTVKPFITIFSSRAHVAISLKKWRNVRNPILVSGFSSCPSLVVNNDGGGAVAGGGGTIHIALYSAS